MSKRLIAITNNDSFDDYDTWMAEINSVLGREGARVVNITCADDSYDDATAWIEVDRVSPKKEENVCACSERQTYFVVDGICAGCHQPRNERPINTRTIESLIEEIDDVRIKEVLKRLDGRTK